MPVCLYFHGHQYRVPVLSSAFITNPPIVITITD
jgi:hypothetical protein